MTLPASASFKPYQNELEGEALNHRVRDGATKILTLAPGLNFFYTEHRFHEACVLPSRNDFMEPVLVITLALKGRSGFRLPSGEFLGFEENTTTISRFMNASGQREYEANMDIFQLRLMVHRSWFESHLGKAFTDQLYQEEEGVKIWMQKPTSPATRKVCERMAQLSLNAPFDQLEIHSLAMSVLKTEIGQLLQTLNETETEAPFSKREEGLMLEAKQIMKRECHLPLTISDLAKRVGMNEHKFKQAMQYFYGMPPFQLLTEIRMQTARDLLLKDTLSIAQVAEQVGYQHSSNFSVAFKKFFDESPGQFRKTKSSRLI